jgi:hypothetical protein
MPSAFQHHTIQASISLSCTNTRAFEISVTQCYTGRPSTKMLVKENTININYPLSQQLIAYKQSYCRKNRASNQHTRSKLHVYTLGSYQQIVIIIKYKFVPHKKTSINLHPQKFRDFISSTKIKEPYFMQRPTKVCMKDEMAI